MRIFQFLKRAIQKIIEPAEDPSKTSKFSIFEHYLRLLKELDQALNEVNKARHQLKKKSQQLRGSALTILSKAKRALAEDHEDLARIALSCRQMILREVETLNQKILEVDKEEERLILIQHRLTTRLEVYRTKHDILSVCQTAADAHIAVGEAMMEIAEYSAALNKALEFAEKNKKDIHARSEDIDEFLRSGNLNDLSKSVINLRDTSEHPGAQIDIEIEKELEAMKKEKKRKEGGRRPS
jgi:phage shock protein A